MKVNNENIDKVLNKLVASTRSPRGRYSADNSWKQLELRMQKRRSLRKLWLRVTSAAAVVVFCVASWAAYNAIYPTAPKSTPMPTETHAEELLIHRDTLIFHQQTLQEITRQLSKAFHTEINIEDDSLKNYRMTATFQDGENLTQILDLLKNAAGNFTYKNTNKTIIITKLN